MNTGEDESTSGLNGRLRPRKSNTTIPSPVGRSSRKTETKPIQDKQKRNSTPSKTPPNRNDDLTNPQRSPDPPFLCPYCDRRFASKLSASKHVRRIHLSTFKQDNFIKCLYCNLSEGNPHNVFRHMVDSHPNQYFACFDCQTRFTSTTELAEHRFNVCEKQKASYRSKLRQKHSHNSTKNKKKLNVEQKDRFSNENKEYTNDKTFNGVVISCELKPTHIPDAADIEDNIPTNLILPPGKTLANTNLQKNNVIVLDDVEWNKRNFTFHNTDADQILSRLGVVHRSPRGGESTRRAWFKMLDENNPKFEKCFDTNFYTRVASNVQENLTRFLDGSFNFNPDADSTIKTRKSKSSVVINTAEGFPILLAYEQFSRHVLDGFMPRQLAPRHKWKWDTTENADNALVDPNAIKSDNHVNNCIVTLVSSLDIWTQLRMRRKYEDVFSKTSSEKTEINNIIASELKEILESRELPASSSQVVKYTNTCARPENRPELPSYLGLSPVEPQFELQPAVLSGEWVRPRCYVCCACGAQSRDSRGLTSHMTTQHPNAQVQHYDIVGEPLLNADIFKHLYVPPNQTANRTRPPRGIRDCTKCKKSIALEDMHQHMLDCAGDTPAVRRKCRTRPFGVRRRRTRIPDNTIRKKIRKEIRSRHRQKGHLRSRPKIRTEVGDAETIRKMIADLPAKRVRVSLNSTLNVKTRKVIENKRNKLKLKRQNADGVKNIITRSRRLNGDKPSVETQSDDDDEPLKVNTRTTPVKKSKERLPKTSTASVKNLSKTNVHVNTASINVKQHGDRNKSTNDQQGGKNIGGSGNKDSRNENNVSHSRDTPLKHSIARLTTNEEVHSKLQETDLGLTLVEKTSSVDNDTSTDTLRQFEDEAQSKKFDKPPLHDSYKTVDPGGVQKSKLSKPRRRLNDCIAMLMQKTSQAQENQSKIEFEISAKNLSNDQGSATSTTAKTEILNLHSATSSKIGSTEPAPISCPTIDSTMSQVSNIAADTISNTEQSPVADNQSNNLPTQATMNPPLESDIVARVIRDATHMDAIRYSMMLAHESLNVANVYERRRSHGDPNLTPLKMSHHESSRRRSSRLKSDTRDYQPRHQYSSLQSYIGLSPYAEYYDLSYANMRRPSYDEPLLLPINQPIYHPHFLPGSGNTLNIPMMSNPMENQHTLPSDNEEINMRTRIASQSPSRRKRTSSDATILSDYESRQIYSQQKSPDHRGQVNNNYIVSPVAKLSPRQPTPMRSHRGGSKNSNTLDSEIRVQRHTQIRTVEDSSEVESSIDCVSGPYYLSRDIACSSISPIGYEPNKKSSEIFYPRVPSKSVDNTSTSNIHTKSLASYEDRLEISSEYLRSEYGQRSHIAEPVEKNIMNELIRRAPSIETERVLLRESPTRHNIENIINIDQTPQNSSNCMLTAIRRTPEPICSSDMIPLDLRSQHKIMSDNINVTNESLQNISFDSECDLLQKSQPRLYVRDISELTGFAVTPLQNDPTNELPRPRTLSQNEELPLNLNKTPSQNQPQQNNSSGLNGQPTMTNLAVARTDNNSISTGILHSNPTNIPIVTVSPPDNENKAKNSDHTSSQTRQNSTSDASQIEPYDINTKQVESLQSQTLSSDPDDALNLTHKTTHTTDKRKLVPKEIIAVIEVLPQEQFDKLLDILPQYVCVSDPQSETADGVTTASDNTNQNIITTNTSVESLKVTATTSVSNLTVNTNLMSAPSCVIPKKRHSPNVTYSSQMHDSRTDCSMNASTTPVHTPTMEDASNKTIISNTEWSINHEINLNDRLTGVLPNCDCNEKIDTYDCLTLTTETNLTKELENPISLEPLKLPARSKHSSEKTSSLRMVRFNSPRKSLSDDKQLNKKDKSTDQNGAVIQNNYEDKQNFINYTIDTQCEKESAAQETLSLDRNIDSFKKNLNDPSVPVITDSREEAITEKQNNGEKNAVAQSNHNFLEEASLPEKPSNKDVALQEKHGLAPYPIDNINPSACETIKIHKSHGIALHTPNVGSIQVNDFDPDKLIDKQYIIQQSFTASMEVSSTNKEIECIKFLPSELEKFNTSSTESINKPENEIDSDDEDVSLADIAKSRRPKRTIKSSSKCRSKIVKKVKQRESANSIEKIMTQTLLIKTPDRNLKTQNGASCNSGPREIWSNVNLKQQDSRPKSSGRVTEVTEMNIIQLQELNCTKKLDGSDNVKSSNRTEENANSGNKHVIDLNYVSSKQLPQRAKDEANENMLSKIQQEMKEVPIINQESELTVKETNSSSTEKNTDSTPTDVGIEQSYNISENIRQKSYLNERDHNLASHKPLLTKKQLIFSKMLHQDETTVSLMNDKNFDTDNCDVSVQSCVSKLKKGKTVKRRRSTQRKRKNKRQLKNFNIQLDNESDSSQSVQDTLIEAKTERHKKKEPNNCAHKSTSSQENFTSSIADNILVDKQTPTSEKRKSEEKDGSTKPKKTKHIDSETITREYGQDNNRDIINDNTCQAAEIVAIEYRGENMLKIKHKDNSSDNKKRKDITSLSEARTTCYNRKNTDSKPSRATSNTKYCENYDPYDIDLDETIAVSEPSSRKTRLSGSSRKPTHTAKPKFPIRAKQSSVSSSDSESSKSDVPLQEYVEEKRKLEQKLQAEQQSPKDHLRQHTEKRLENVSESLLVPQLQQQPERQQLNNDQELIDDADGAVDTLNVSETAATANALEILYHIDIDLNGAEKAKSVFIPEEELDASSLKKRTENVENNEQLADNQSTSTERQSLISASLVQSEESCETMNRVKVTHFVPQIIENIEFQDSKTIDEPVENQNNNGLVEANKTIENKMAIEDKLCDESEKLEEVKDNTDMTKSIETKSKPKTQNKNVEKEIKKVKDSQDYKTIKENKSSKASLESKDAKNSKEKSSSSKRRRRRRRSKNTVVNVNHDQNTKTSEETDTEKYLETFGFFPEKKPRRSNLLAMKKISETMNLINEGDDIYFSSKDLPNNKSRGKSSESESLQGTSNDSSMTVDTPECSKLKEDELQNRDKISDEDRAMDVDSNLNKHDSSEIINESDAVTSKHDCDSLEIGETTSQVETPLDDQSPVENTNVENKKSNKSKVPKVRPPGYKEKMYPDIEEFDLFEDKFDKIKRKSRTQAAAAKQTSAMDPVPSTSGVSKKTEKKKKKCVKKSYHSTVVRTKGALKGFEGFKISAAKEHLNMSPNGSPPNASPSHESPPDESQPPESQPQESPPHDSQAHETQPQESPRISPSQLKKRKRSISKKKRERNHSDSSSSSGSRDMNLQEKDIYEFKDNDDTELLELRPSTVMDRFRSLNKEKTKREKCKDKESHKDKKAKRIEISDDEIGMKKKSKQFDGIVKIDDNTNKFYQQGSYKFNDEILSGSVENIAGPSTSKDAMSCNNFSQDDDTSRNLPNDDDDDDDDNVCLVSRSRFVPPTNDDSSFEWNGSPESGFVHMSDCNCLPDSKLDETERICDSSNCIYRKPNPEKNAVMGKIFKNNAVRRDAGDDPDIQPKANLDQLFDSLLETNSNDVSSEQNVSDKNREISPIPGPSNLYTSYHNDISPRANLLKSQTLHNRVGKRDKKSRLRNTDDAFTRLLETSPYVTPPKIDEELNNEDLYRQCILSHNEDACSSDSTDQSNNVGPVDEYVMMSSKNTQTEDPDTIIEDCNIKIKSYSDDEESDLEPESNDIIVLRRYVSTKSHSAQTDDLIESEYYFDYEEITPQPGDYAMVSTKSTQTRKHKSKSKHNHDSSEEDFFNALEKTKITLKKFVATTTKFTQTAHRTKQRKSSKHEESDSLKPEPSTSTEQKRYKKKKVHKTETKVIVSDDESSAKEDDGVNNTEYEPVEYNSEYEAGVARHRARRKCTVGKQNVLAEHWSSESEAESARPSVSGTSATRKKRGRKRANTAARRTGIEAEERPELTHCWTSDNETGAQPQHGWIVGDSHKKLVTLLANAKGRKRHEHDKRHAD